MERPEEYVIEGLEAVAAVAFALQQRSEGALAGRLEAAGRQILHAFIEVSSRKEAPPEEPCPGALPGRVPAVDRRRRATSRGLCEEARSSVGET